MNINSLAWLGKKSWLEVCVFPGAACSQTESGKWLTESYKIYLIYFSYKSSSATAARKVLG